MLLVLFAVTVVSARSYYESNHKFIATTWTEYFSECGSKEPSYCLKKYRGKEFKNWEGFLLKIEDNRQY